MIIISIKISTDYHVKIIDYKAECRDAIQIIINSIIAETLTNSDQIREVYYFTLDELEKKGNILVKELKINEN